MLPDSGRKHFPVGSRRLLPVSERRLQSGKAPYIPGTPGLWKDPATVYKGFQNSQEGRKPIRKNRQPLKKGEGTPLPQDFTQEPDR